MTKTVLTNTYKVRTLPFIIIGVIILSITIFATVWLASQIKPRKPKPFIQTTPLVTLRTATPSNNNAVLSSGGFVTAKYDSKIAAEVGGTVLYISPKFAIGNTVKKGEVLASISDSDYLANILNAEAALSSASSKLTQEQAKSRQAGRDAQRLKIKITDLVLRKPQLLAAKANLANAKIQLKIAKDNLDKASIKAPFDAIIKSRNISLGDNLTPNTIVAQLIGTDTFVAKLTLSNYLFTLINIGDEVSLHDHKTGNTFLATISRFDPSIDSKTRTIGAYIEIQQPLSGAKPLLLNTYLFATIKGATIPNSLWIDNNANVENSHVWIMDGNNRLKKISFLLIYREDEKSLVKFSQPINHFISNPRDSFFEGEIVTTKKLNDEKRSHNKANKKSGKSHE